jgi:hypothetical protein
VISELIFSTSPDLEDANQASPLRDFQEHNQMTPVTAKEGDNESLADKDVTLTPGLTVVELEDDADDMLKIESETEEERLDTGLEKKSQNVEHVQLTVKNVRSIIHVSY